MPARVCWPSAMHMAAIGQLCRMMVWKVEIEPQYFGGISSMKSNGLVPCTPPASML